MPKGSREQGNLVTAQEVARLAGVSRSAVSRTFTPGASVAPATREKVEAAATALGYSPNPVARSLTTGRSNIVGLVVRYMNNQFYPALTEALSQRLSRRGKQLLLFSVDEKAEDTEQYLEAIIRYRVEALILTSSSLSSNLATRCRQLGIKVVLINRVTQDTSCHSVTGDNEAGGYELGNFLAECGYQRPAFIAGLEDSSTSREREAGFVKALAEHDIPLFARRCGNYDYETAAGVMRELLGRKVRPDVVFCANDHMAFAAHNVAREEFGLEVGRDIALVGFDDVEMAAWPCFSLTTYSQPVQAMADEAIRIIATDLDASVHSKIRGRLVVRGSARGRRR